MSRGREPGRPATWAKTADDLGGLGDLRPVPQVLEVCSMKAADDLGDLRECLGDLRERDLETRCERDRLDLRDLRERERLGDLREHLDLAAACSWEGEGRRELAVSFFDARDVCDCCQQPPAVPDVCDAHILEVVVREQEMTPSAILWYAKVVA